MELELLNKFYQKKVKKTCGSPMTFFLQCFFNFFSEAHHVRCFAWFTNICTIEECYFTESNTPLLVFFTDVFHGCFFCSNCTKSCKAHHINKMRKVALSDYVIEVVRRLWLWTKPEKIFKYRSFMRLLKISLSFLN